MTETHRYTLRDDAAPHQIRLLVRGSNHLVVGCTCGAEVVPTESGLHWIAFRALDHDLRRGPVAYPARAATG